MNLFYSNSILFIDTLVEHPQTQEIRLLTKSCVMMVDIREHVRALPFEKSWNRWTNSTSYRMVQQELQQCHGLERLKLSSYRREWSIEVWSTWSICTKRTSRRSTRKMPWSRIWYYILVSVWKHMEIQLWPAKTVRSNIKISFADQVLHRVILRSTRRV